MLSNDTKVSLTKGSNNAYDIIFNQAPTAPGVISGPAAVNAWQQTAITWTWGASTDPDGDAVTYVVEKSVNGGSWSQAASTSGLTYSHTVSGSDNNVRIRVKATDGYANESDYTTGGYTYITHNSPPTAPTNLNPSTMLANAWETSSVIYTWTASTDANGDTITYIVERNLNNGGWIQVASTTAPTYTHSVSSTHNTVQVRVKASDGKEESGYATSALTTIVHDTTPPSLSLTAAPDSSSGWTSSDIVITAVMADALSGLQRITAPAGVTPTGTVALSGNISVQTFTVKNVGTYTFTVYDKANLSTTASITVGNVDQIPPVISYTTSIPDGQFTNGDVEIYFTLSDTLSGLQRFVTPAGPVELSGGSQRYTYTATQNGAPTFTLLDNVFNNSAVNIIINMIDRVKPNVTVNAAVNQWNNQSGTTLAIAGSDDYSGVASLELPDSSVYPRGSTDYPITENGVYTAAATDRAGNVSAPVSVNYQWFDRTPPTITSLRFEETNVGLIARFSSLFSDKDIVTNKQIKMYITYDDTPTGTEGKSGVETIRYRVYDYEGNAADGWVTASVNDTIPNIDYEVNGYVEVQVTDRAGNASAVEKYEILLDSTPPGVTYIASETGVTNQPVVVSLRGEDEAGGSGFKGFLLPDGNVFVSQSEIPYTFYENASKTFIGYDHAGNRTPVTVTVSNIKSAPPVLEDIIIEKTGAGLLRSLLGSLGGQAYNEQVKVTIVATDPGPVTIYYCVTPGGDIPEDANWLEAPDGIVRFDTEMTGVIHGKAVDIASNWSNTMSRALILDRAPPILTIELEPRENDFEPVIMKVLATDDTTVAGISGVVGITTPDGQLVQQDYLEYTVKQNGSYTFKTADYAGNETQEVITVDYIRPVLPEDWENNVPVIDAVLHASGKHYIGNVDYDDILGLRYLDLSAKGLEALPGILGYGKNITRLDLRGNELKQVPECVFRLKSLEYLDLSNNELLSIDDKVTELRLLEYLDVSLNYLVDYECQAIVGNYRNVGNFTYNGQPEQYSFAFAPPEYGKEYIGNTVQVSVLWDYDGRELEGSLERHRKALYSEHYSDYKTYRPLIFGYRVTGGEVKTNTPDYAQVYLPVSGVMRLNMTLGSGGEGSPPVSDMGNVPVVQAANVLSGSGIAAASEGVEVLGLPTPAIQGIDVDRGVILVDVGVLDESIQADIKVIVEVWDTAESLLATSEVKVNGSKLCEVPVALVLQKGHIITARLVNNDFAGDNAQDTNQNENGSRDSGGNGGSSGGGTEYIVVETVVEKEVILEVEKINTVFVHEGGGGWSRPEAAGNSGGETEIPGNRDESSRPAGNGNLITYGGGTRMEEATIEELQIALAEAQNTLAVLKAVLLILLLLLFALILLLVILYQKYKNKKLKEESEGLVEMIHTLEEEQNK